MNSKLTLEEQWNHWENELDQFEPHSVERRKALHRIAEIWSQLVDTSQRLQADPLSKDPGQRYFGLDPLKISALNLAIAIENDEEEFLSLYLRMTHCLILSNIMRLRILPRATRKLQTQFHTLELVGFPKAKYQFEDQERELWKERVRIQNEIAELRDEYEMFVFTESSYEAARSFGTAEPDIQNHRSSWLAFSNFLTAMSVQVRAEHRAMLIKKSNRISAQREAIFENCAELLAKPSDGKDAKKVQKQLRHNLAEIKRLEQEIEATLSELSVPGLGDNASLLVKKKPGEATTFQLTKNSLSTGDKT